MSSRTKVPYIATLVTSVLAFLVILVTVIDSDILTTIIFPFSVVGIYMSFQLVVFARIVAYIKSKGQDPWRTTEPGYFHLKQLSLPVAIIAQIYGVLMILNLLWPRNFHQLSSYITLIITAIVIIAGLICMTIVFTYLAFNKKNRQSRQESDGDDENAFLSSDEKL